MKTLNLKNVNSINRNSEFIIVKDNSKNFALVSGLDKTDSYIITIQKYFNNKIIQKTLSRKTKEGTINLIKREFKVGNTIVSK